MTDLNKQELRRLPEASAEIESWYELADFRAGRYTDLELDVVSEADRSFIVSASPATILSLLDEVDSARSTSQYWKDEHLAANAEIERLRAEGEALRKDAAAIRRQFEYWKQRARSAEGHIYSPKSDLRCAAKALQPRTRLRDRAWHELSELEQYELMLAAHDVIRAVDQSRHARRPKDMSVISASSCGGPGCCQLCADEKAGEVGNG